jgi:hypothetical protein
MDHSIAASLASADCFLADYRRGAIREGKHYGFEDRNYQDAPR